MINKTLDLPFDEPQETYSTSEHLFHDQGIAPGTKGRIVDAAPVERKPREDRGGRDGGRGRGGRSGGGDRAARATATATAAAPAPAAVEPVPRRRRPPATRPARRRPPTPTAPAGRQPQPQPPSPLARGSGGGEPPPAPPTPPDHTRRTALTRRRARASGRASAQAVTTTVVPSGANSHSAIGVGALLADAAVRLRGAELGDGLHALAVVDRDVVEADGGVLALGEADEVLHRARVVDAVGLLGARVDLVGAGVEVVVELPETR